MEHLAYIRVSTVDQNTERQLSDTGIVFNRTFEDKCSGGSTDRPALDALKVHVRKGDIIHIHSIDRLARNLEDLQALIKGWNSEGVTVKFHKEGLTFQSGDDSPMSTLMLSVLGAVAQFERSMIKERQREGIAKAKAAGVYTGRKADADRPEQIRKLRAEGLSIRGIAEKLGCNPSTVQRALKG